MPNILGEKFLEVAEEYKKNKTYYSSFLEYYTDYLDEHFYIEKLNPEKIASFIDAKLNVLSSLSVEQQNVEILNLVNELKDWFIEDKILKSINNFDALRFLALTTFGRLIDIEQC